MKKVLIFLLYLFTSLFCCFITTMIIDKRIDSVEKNEVDSNENVDSNEMYEKLVIEEVVEIYGSDVYGYIIEEFELETENDDVKYCCLVRFYDEEIYVERIMYVDEIGFVYTEEVLKEIEIS